jgi:hypothetical protein
MVLRMQQGKPLSGHMGINRRRRNIGVAQQHLHGSQICAMVE